MQMNDLKEQKARIITEAQKWGSRGITPHGPGDIDKDEFNLIWGNQEDLSSDSGYGKFKSSNKFLNTLQDGEFLFYADAGCTLNENGIEELHSWYESLENSPHSALGFQLRRRECDYTTKQIFEAAGAPRHHSAATCDLHAFCPQCTHHSCGYYSRPTSGSIF